MTNVSKRKTESEEYREAETQFYSLLGSVNKQKAESFFTGLFTETEQVMFIKRFGAIFMFNQGFAPYTVSTRIAISLSTAQRIYTHYLEGRYNALLKQIPKKQQSAFLDLLIDFSLSKGSITARKNLMKRLR
jgi:uncharacterized protein YerC